MLYCSWDVTHKGCNFIFHFALLPKLKTKIKKKKNQLDATDWQTDRWVDGKSDIQRWVPHLIKWETFFLKNHSWNVVEKLFLCPFFKNQNWAYHWINSLKFYSLFRWGTHLYMLLFLSARQSVCLSVCLSVRPLHTISQEPHIIWSYASVFVFFFLFQHVRGVTAKNILIWKIKIRSATCHISGTV